MTTIDRRYGVAEGLAVKAPCRAATTANITLSGEQTIDGVAVVASDRVLVWNQTNTVDNGIWVCGTGTWTRDLDFDGQLDIVKGTRLFVTDGSNYGVTDFYVSTTGIIGTDPIGFSAIPPGRLVNTRTVTSGNVSVAANDDVIVLNKAAPQPTTVTLPAVASRIGLSLEIYDFGGNAGDITITPNGAETIMGLSSWTVVSGGVAGSGGSLRLIPTTIGWVIR
jgi:uncharacterized cupin superfamily protein